MIMQGILYYVSTCTCVSKPPERNKNQERRKRQAARLFIVGITLVEGGGARNIPFVWQFRTRYSVSFAGRKGQCRMGICFTSGRGRALFVPNKEVGGFIPYKAAPISRELTSASWGYLNNKLNPGVPRGLARVGCIRQRESQELFRFKILPREGRQIAFWEPPRHTLHNAHKEDGWRILSLDPLISLMKVKSEAL